MGKYRQAKEVVTLDDEFRLGIVSPVCSLCVHLRDVADRKCIAFPDGIPDVIWMGGNDHRRPYPGDNGIQFKAK
jgi:hypothetical protein